MMSHKLKKQRENKKINTKKNMYETTHDMLYLKFFLLSYFFKIQHHDLTILSNCPFDLFSPSRLIFILVV